MTASPRKTIRPDCHRLARVTYQEAAFIAGLSIKTIRNAATRGALRTFPGATAFKVDRLSLEAWAFHGIDHDPQKTAAAKEHERRRKAGLRAQQQKETA